MHPYCLMNSEFIKIFVILPAIRHQSEQLEMKQERI